MTTTQKCERSGCNCQSEGGKKHCGKTCTDTKQSPEEPCQCKHPKCSDIRLKMWHGLMLDASRPGCATRSSPAIHCGCLCSVR